MMPQTSRDPNFKPTLYKCYRLALINVLKTYEEKTGKDLASDPLLHRVEACHSSDDITTILGQQILGVDHVQSSNDGMTRWLNPNVDVIHSFSLL
jgi:hypothetical protein